MLHHYLVNKDVYILSRAVCQFSLQFDRQCKQNANNRQSEYCLFTYHQTQTNTKKKITNAHCAIGSVLFRHLLGGEIPPKVSGSPPQISSAVNSGLHL